jgi:hypothetical protein
MERVRVRFLRPVLGLALALSLSVPAAVSAQVPPVSESPSPSPSPTATTSPTPSPSPSPSPSPTPAPEKKTKADRAVYRDYSDDGVISACKHTTKTLKHTLETITPEFDADYDDFRKQVNAAIKAHKKGRCDKPKPEATATSTPAPSNGGSPPSSGGSPPASNPAPAPAPAAPAPAPPAPAPAPSNPGALPKTHHGGGGGKAVPPPASTAVPPAATPAPVPPAATAPQEAQVVVSRPHDEGSLALPLILGAIALAGLAAAGSSALLGTHVPRFAGMGQAWREAAYRTSGTWGDFTDWLHLGR